jgi:hypothetical protein
VEVEAPEVDKGPSEALIKYVYIHTDVDPTPMRLCPYRLVKNVLGRAKIRFTPFLGYFGKNLEKAVFLA